VHETAHLGQRGLIAARPAAPRLGARGDIPGRPAPSEELLHEGEADPNEGGNGALRAALLITGAEALLSEVKARGFHTQEHNAVPPYIQSRTALGQVIRQGRGNRTQEDMAEAPRFQEVERYAEYERGKRIPSQELLLAICEQLSLKRGLRDKLRRMYVPLSEDEKT
jgi:hypothetical protein